MHNFEYVSNYEWKPVKDKLLKIISRLQDEVRNYFTFRYDSVGSSKRKMITCDRNSNIGYDFDVNIEVNDPNENYSPKEIRDILRRGLDRVTTNGYYTFGFGYAEDSTRVLTIKVNDNRNYCILHSCDFCIIHNCNDGQQQYIRYNKSQQSYSWEYQPKGYENLSYKIEWIKNKKLWQKVRDEYIYKKNMNNNPNKHSRSIFAETIHEIWNKNLYIK